MKKFNTAKLLFGFLGLSTFASLVGTVSGTLAWYSYNTRVSISYSGTSIENTVQLQVGLLSANEMPHDDSDPDNVEFWNVMEQEEDFSTDGAHYYFAPLGVGLTSQVINAYLKVNGYATNELRPLTTGYYDPEDPLCDFALKRSPTSTHYTQDVLAGSEDYLKLPLIFRATRSRTSVNDFVAGQELWLTEAKAVAYSEGDGEIYKAMRIFFDRKDSDYATDFIVNPNVADAGETKVGGLLDMTYDQYYDYDNNGEVIYGEWESPADPYTLLSDSGYVPPVGGNPVLDLNRSNNTLEDEDANNFCARHYPGSKYFDYEAMHGESGIKFKTAKYESLASIAPVRNVNNGTLTNANPLKPSSICKTGGESDHFIGFVEATIWLEGWDYSVVDEEISHAFNFGLTFEINKVGAHS